MRRRSPPLFLAIFGLVLLTLLVSQLVAAGLLVLVRPGGPAAMSTAAVAAEIRGGSGQLRVRTRALPPPRAQSEAEARVAAELARALGVEPADVHVDMARMQRDRFILVDMGTADAPDVRPVLVGDFSVSVRGSDGRWRSFSPVGEAVFDTVEKRYVLLFVAGALLMLPVAWWLSRLLARPFAEFARAAERVGQDPEVPVPIIRAPLEARLASEALAAMARALAGQVRRRIAMVGALAHDFRTPLTRLAFRVEGLPEEVRAPMAADIRELDQMVTATLAFVRGGPVLGERTRLELGSLVEEVADALGGPIAFAAVEPAVVLADPLALRRMFANLLQNALTYGERATVTVRVRAAHAEVDIADEGPGLPTEDLVRVFEPFYRADPSRNRGGIGLGMPIAAAVARAHGGSVTLRNLEPRGLRVRVRLPLAPRGEAQVRAGAEAGGTAGTEANRAGARA